MKTTFPDSGVLESLRQVVETQAIHSKMLEVLVNALVRDEDADGALIRTLGEITAALTLQNESVSALTAQIVSLPNLLTAALDTELRALLLDTDVSC